MRPREEQVLKMLDQAQDGPSRLAGLLRFYRDLYTVQYAAKAEIPDRDGTLLCAASRQRLATGEPCLEFPLLGVEPEALASLAREIAAVLAAHDDGMLVDDSAEELDASVLMALAERIFDDPGMGQDGESSSGVWTVAVELALIPYLERAAEAVASHLDLESWGKPYCPICGGAPDLSLLDKETAARSMICSRCSTEWPYARLQCPACGNRTQSQIKYFADDEDTHRLYVCQECKHYLKTVNLRNLGRKVLPPVERIVTAGMDVAAQARGYWA